MNTIYEHPHVVDSVLQNTANGISLKTKDDMLRLDAMVMTVQLGIRKLLARTPSLSSQLSDR